MFDLAPAEVPVADPPDAPGGPVAWSEYGPDGLLADMLVEAGERGPLRPMHPDDHGFEMLERIGAWERVIAWAQAHQLAEMAGYLRHAQAQPRYGQWLSEALDAAVAEIGLMLRVAHRTAADRVDTAVELVERLPQVHAALSRGRLGLPGARAIAEETATLSATEASDLVGAVLSRADSQTAGQLRAATRRAVLEADPGALRERHQRAVSGRDVWLDPGPDGMASLTALLPADQAVAAYTTLDRLAHRSAGPDDDRGIGARRADALVDLLGGGVRGRVDVQLRVTVPITSLVGIDQRPAELAGYGPIPAELARTLAADATWRRLLTDPASGAVIDYGTTRYRPPAHLAELVRARHPHCSFPGCRIPAHRCDLDHNQPYDPGRGTGPTSADNLGPKCRRHHKLKQLPGWRVEQRADGTVSWHTPSRHTYQSRPPPG